MQTLKHLVLVVLAIFYMGFSFSQKVSPEVISIFETDSSIQIDFNLPSYQVIDTNIYSLYGIDQDFNYIKVNHDNFGNIWDIGFPSLPQLTINFAIPKGSTNFTINSDSINSDSIQISHRLIPNQEDDKDTLYPFSINQQYYNSDGSVYSIPFILSDEYILMGQDGISLTIFPFHYNPSQNSISVINNANYIISFIPPSIQKDTILPDVKEDFIERFYQNYTKSELKNGSSNSYLIITPSRFESLSTIKVLTVYWYGGEPFLAWDKMLKINNEIQRHVVKKELIYNSCLITNGSLMTEEKIKHFNN